MSSLSGAPTLSPELFDLVGCEVRVLVLPEAEYLPAGIPKKRICLLIAPSVAFDLVAPVSGVGAWLPVMEITPVPVATIDEDCDLR